MKEKIIGVSILYLIIWCVSPPLAYGTIYRLLALCIIASLFMWCVLQDNCYITRYQMILLVLMVYMVLLLLVTGDSYSHRIGTFIMLCMALSMRRLFEGDLCDVKRLWWIIPVTLALCIVWNFATLREIATNPSIMRILAKNADGATSYSRKGVGGYGYMYTVLIMIPIAFDFLLNKRNQKWARIVALVFIVTSYYLAFSSQYFLVILVSIMIPFVYLGNRIKASNARKYYTVCIVILFIVAYANIDTIIEWALGIFNTGSTVARKIQDFYDILLGDSIENTEFSTRFNRYVGDLVYIFWHPIQGGFTYSVTGNHSYFLDIIAQYGIPIGALCIVEGFIKPFGWVKSNTTSRSVVLIVFLIVAFLNTIPFAMGTVIYILMPLHEFCSLEEPT